MMSSQFHTNSNCVAPKGNGTIMEDINDDLSNSHATATATDMNADGGSGGTGGGSNAADGMIDTENAAAAAAATTSNNNPQQQQLLCASCDYCRSRKTKCDGKRPCANCLFKYMKKNKVSRYAEKKPLH
jgi:Fungal Zn(2)-Cys(6) binuclear cluster domain